jgi:single-stranded-DNA-specific exonuclease
MEFHLKGLTLQWHFLIIALDLRYKITRSCRLRKGTKNIDYHLHHHRPGKNLPEAIAVLDPKETIIIHDELCGCGIDLN